MQDKKRIVESIPNKSLFSHLPLVRVLDMSHSLIQQTKEKRREVFGVVKERIVTTQPSSVIEEVQQTGALGGLLSLCGPKALKVLGNM